MIVHYYLGDINDAGGSLPMTACRPKGAEGIEHLSEKWERVNCKKCLSYKGAPQLSVNDGYWSINLTCHGTQQQAELLYSKVSRVIKKMNLTCVGGTINHT